MAKKEEVKEVTLEERVENLQKQKEQLEITLIKIAGAIEIIQSIINEDSSESKD